MLFYNELILTGEIRPYKVKKIDKYRRLTSLSQLREHTPRVQHCIPPARCGIRGV